MVVIATKHEKNLVQCFTKIKIIFVHSIVPDIFVTIRNMILVLQLKKNVSVAPNV